jgi:hypothetical protein
MFLAALMSASKSPPHVVHTKRAPAMRLSRIDGAAGAAGLRRVRRIDEDERRSVPLALALALALVLEHGSDRPRRDLEQCPVLVCPFLDQRSWSLDRAAAGLRHLLGLQVLDDAIRSNFAPIALSRRHVCHEGLGRYCCWRIQFPSTS